MSDVDLIINVHTNGIKDVANLSASVKALTADLRAITIPMTKLDTQSRAVNKALGLTNHGMREHAKTIKELKENQRALGEESKRLKNNIVAYTGAIRAAGGPTTALGKELTSSKAHLQSMSAAMRGARVRAFGSDIASVSLRMQKMGKDAQFVGRSLMINLTAPIMLFGRLGFQSLLKVDKEATRLSKVFDSVAMSAEQAAMKVGLLEGELPSPDQARVMAQMVSNFKALDKALTGVSSEFGVSKDIVVGLASDFAELGVVGQDNVVILTELTTTIEKLGGMDIGPAKDLSQALYFNAKRAFEANGAFRLVTNALDRETMAIKSAQTQLAMFNAVENVTALTLQDLADALPEVGSMATAFGLSMTEAAAMLAPMKAAGLDVGASATSIKTSLQRLIIPTKKNIDFMAKLAAQYGVTSDATDAFNNTTKTGLVGLEAIVDVFSKVQDSAAGTEGALKLMSQLFEKRQGPRMYIAIQQLSMFNKELNTVTRKAGSAEGDLASIAEKAIVQFNKLNNTSLKATINNFRDIGILARVAAGTAGTTVDGYKGKGSGGALSSDDIATAKAARSAVAAQIRKDRAEGKDSFAAATTEAGKAMLVQLAGPITASEIASQELDVTLKSLSTSVQKIKNNFKLFAAEVLTNLGPAIKWLSAKMEQFRKYWEGLSQSTRENVTRVIGLVLLFLAAIGPVVIAMGTMQASIGVLGRGFAFFLPKIRNAEGGLVAFGSSAEVARQKIDNFYNTLRNTKSGALGSSAAGMASMKTLDDAAIVANQASGTVGKAVRAGAAVNLAGNVAPVPESLAFLTPGSPERAAAVARNRTARLAHASSGRGVVDQYMRNETQMLGKKGMRLNAAGRVIGPGATGFVGGGMLGKVSDASALRESTFAAKGLTRGTDGELFRTTGRGVERRITERQGMRIARGGIRGQIAKVTPSAFRLGEVSGRLTSATGVTGKGFVRGMLPDFEKPTTPFPKMSTSSPLGFVKQASQNIGQRMMPKNLVGAQGAANVGGIAKGLFNAGPVAAYTKSVEGAKTALRAMRVQQMAVGGGNPLKTAIVAMKGFASATKLGTIALKLFKFAMISTGIGVVIAAIGIAILVIVKNFDKFREAGSGAFATIKAAFTIFKNALLEIARPFLDLFAMFGKGGKEGKSAVGGLAAAFGGIATAVKFVAGLFQKFVMNVIQPYLYMIINIVMFVVSIFKGNWGDAFDFLKAAVYQIVKFVVQGFALLIKGVIQVVAFGIKLVIGYFTLIPKAVAKSFSWLSKLPGMGFLKSVGNGIDNVIDGLYGMVDAAKGGAMGAVDAIAGAITNGLDKGISKGVKKSKGAIDIFKNKGTTAAEPAGEAIADDMGDGFADGDLAGAMKKEIQDVLQTLQDYVAGELKGAVDKYVTQAEDALKKQKDAALKVFDVQITTLDKLEKAQESLTKTMAYETEKRKRIDEKALTDEQFRRNYALAVYEGRVDDARMMQLEQGASEKSFSEDMLSIETKRGEELAKENLDALKTAIAEAKTAASDFFDKSIADFQAAAALITKFPPVTIQDYQTQVGLLQTLTTDAALANSTEFGNMFEAFSTTIADKMPNKVIGPFTTSLDSLVTEAQKKYGLGGNPDEKSVIGATLGMLTDMGVTFGDNKQAVVDSFGLVSAGLVGNFTDAKTEILRVVNEDFLTPFATASATFVTGWEAIYKQAFVDGNKSIIDSFRNTVALNKTLMEEMAKNLDPAVNKWLALKAAVDAANGAASGGGAATTPPTTPSTSGGAGGRADAFENNNANRVARGQTPLTYQQYITRVGIPGSNIGNAVVTRAKGGVIPSGGSNNGYIGSGFINAPTQEGVPALLHGGEYVINAKAVSRLGLGALEKLNNNLIPRFAKGGYVAPKKGSIPFGGEDKIIANSIKKAPAPLQGPYGTSIPVVASPTINLKSLPLVKNPLPGEGAVSTVRSASFGIGKGEVLLPTVVKGKILSDTNAFSAYANGGYKDHLGVYPNTAAANKAAEVIHLSEANRIAQVAKAQAQRNVDLNNAGIAKNFVGPVAPIIKPEKKGFLSKVGGFVKELARPSNSFALIGGGIGTALGALGGFGFGAIPGGIGGAAIGGAIGTFTEQAFDKVKGFQPLGIAKNAAMQGVFQAAGIGIAKYAAPLLKTLSPKPIVSRLASVGKSLTNAAVEKMGLSASGMSLGEIMKPGVTLARKAGLNSLFPKYLPTKQEYLAAKAYTQEVGAKLNQYSSGYSDSEYREAYEVFRQTKKSQAYKYASAQVNNYKKMPKILDKIEKYVALSGLGEPVRRSLEYIPGIKSPSQDVRSSNYNSNEYAYLASPNIPPDPEWLNSTSFNGTNILLNNLSEILAYHKGQITFVDGLPAAAILARKGLSVAAKAWGGALNLKTKIVRRSPGYPISLDNDYEGIFKAAYDDTYYSDGLGVAVNPYISNDESGAHARAFHFVSGGTRKPRMVTHLGLNWNRTMSTIHGALLGLDAAVPGAIDSFGAKVFELLGRVPSGPMKVNTSVFGDVGLFQQLSTLGGMATDPVGWYSQLMMHEMGHNFNLDHPHEYENSRGKVDTKSIMSYESGFSNSKFLPGDIAGIKAMLDVRPEYNAMDIPRFKKGGYVPGSPSTPIPAILHGGEYVVNADAVRSMGVSAMQSINRSKFNVPSGAPSYSGGGSNSVSTVNINVETFVGEEEWFKSMMKSYNVNVLPKMNKAAGNESRTFTSYNGIN